MYLGEICLFTRDVRRLAAFYKQLLQVENHSDAEVYQAILESEPMLTILRREDLPDGAPQRAALAFTVADLEAAHAHVLGMGAAIVQPPMKQPWGTANMILADPDGNQIYLRQFAAPKEERPHDP